MIQLQNTFGSQSCKKSNPSSQSNKLFDNVSLFTLSRLNLAYIARKAINIATIATDKRATKGGQKIKTADVAYVITFLIYTARVLLAIVAILIALHSMYAYQKYLF